MISDTLKVTRARKTWNVSVRNSMEDPRVVLFFLHKDLSNLRWMPSVHSAEWSVIDFCPNNAMQVSTLLLLATKQGDSNSDDVWS